MTDYFTHLARRTLGVTTASDPRPVRMPSAAVDWTRPVQLPEGSLAQETEASRAQLVDSLERPVRATAGAVRRDGSGLGDAVPAQDVARLRQSAQEEPSFTAQPMNPPADQSKPAPLDRQHLAQRNQPIAELRQQHAESNHQRPELSDQHAELSQQHAESSHQHAESNHQRPELSYQRPESNHQRPESSQQHAESGQPRPELSDQYAESGQPRPESSQPRPESSQQFVSRDQQRASSSQQFVSRDQQFVSRAQQFVSDDQQSEVRGPSAVGGDERLASQPDRRTDARIASAVREPTAALAERTEAARRHAAALDPSAAGAWLQPASGGVSGQKAAPPEVHIRIGRIEVRSPQVVQAARSAPAELRPTLSLAGVLAGAKGK